MLGPFPGVSLFSTILVVDIVNETCQSLLAMDLLLLGSGWAGDRAFIFLLLIYR